MGYPIWIASTQRLHFWGRAEQVPPFGTRRCTRYCLSEPGHAASGLVNAVPCVVILEDIVAANEPLFVRGGFSMYL